MHSSLSLIRHSRNGESSRMASSVSICFFPKAMARPKSNTRNPRRISKSSPNPSQRKGRTRTNSRDFPLPQPLSSVPGGEATTYTRLPPKDDFFLSSSDTSYQSSGEVKLSESNVPNRNTSGGDIGNDELSGEEDEFVRNLGFSYEKYELFEVNSDSECEDDDDDEDEDFDDDDDGGDVMLGFERGEDEDGLEGRGEVKEKEKGVPAVMRCFDRAKIYVKAGDGGNGVVAFRREKYVPFGGPSGGDGGRGGNVYVEVDGSMNSLLPLRQSIHFRAGRGQHGQGRKQSGAKGEDVVVKVAPGTVIREAGGDGERGEVLLELLHPGQRALFLPGGRGGRGNASFKSGTNRVPKIAENGEEGPEM